MAPVWVPWSDRIAPGDVVPGTVLPRRVDDPLLEPGFEATGDEGSSLHGYITVDQWGVAPVVTPPDAWDTWESDQVWGAD